MIANLYNYGGDPRVVDKTAQLGLVTSVECEFFGEYNLLNPLFKLNYSGVNFNYIYISDLNRYYFVLNHRISNGMINAVETRVDVLMSAKTAVLNSNATIIRSGTRATDIPDSKYPIVDFVDVHNDFVSVNWAGYDTAYAITVTD